MISLSRIKDNDMDQLIRAEVYKMDRQRQELTRLIIDYAPDGYDWLRSTLSAVKDLITLDRRHNPKEINLSLEKLRRLRIKLDRNQSRMVVNTPKELQGQVNYHLATIARSVEQILNLTDTTAYPYEDSETHLQRICGNLTEPTKNFRMLVSDRSPKAQFKHLREFMVEMQPDPALRDLTLAEIYAVDEDSETIQTERPELYNAAQDLKHYIFIGVFPPYEDIPEWIRQSTPRAMRPITPIPATEQELTMNEKLENLGKFLKQLQQTPKIREMSLNEIYRTEAAPKRPRGGNPDTEETPTEDGPDGHEPDSQDRRVAPQNPAHPNQRHRILTGVANH